MSISPTFRSITLPSGSDIGMMRTGTLPPDFLNKVVASRVEKGKFGCHVFRGKSKTLCPTNTRDRFITAAYKACQPSPPKLERQGLNPTQIPIHSSWLTFSLGKNAFFYRPFLGIGFKKFCVQYFELFSNMFWHIWSDARKIGLLSSRQNSLWSHQTLLWDNDVGGLRQGK